MQPKTSKQSIFDAEDLRSAVIKVPEWGGVEIHASTITAGERIAMIELAQKNPEQPWVCVVLVACAKESDGKRMFDDGDIEALAKKSADVLSRVSKEIESLSGSGSAVEVEKKA